MLKGFLAAEAEPIHPAGYQQKQKQNADDFSWQP
jgi:hypothetical protein